MTVVKSTTAVINWMYETLTVIHCDRQGATFHIIICYYVVVVVFQNENTHSSFPAHPSIHSLVVARDS